MSDYSLKFTSKKVDDVIIASIRFRGQHAEIPEKLSALRESVKDFIIASPMCLYWAKYSDALELEVCYPVSQILHNGNFTCRHLDGGYMLSAIHPGALMTPEEPERLLKSWEQFWGYIHDFDIDLEVGPDREIYLEGFEQHGDDQYKYITELQTPILLQSWLERLDNGLKEYAGGSVAHTVMAGSNRLTVESSREDRAKWVKAAMNRLDKIVPEDESRKTILRGCAHRFPKEKIDFLRTEYQRHGDIDKLLESMGHDRSCGEHSFYGIPERKGNVIYETKIPCEAEQFRNAGSDLDKRYHYCHCGMVREAIKNQDNISPTFCNCGAGWYQQAWEGILEKPVKVEVLGTVLQGEDACRFAIHLPG